MKTKHTPGPWFTGCNYPKGIQIITVNSKTDEPNGLIAKVNKGAWCNKEIDTANARLIAASPDLLEACKAVLHCNNYSQSGPISAEFSDVLNMVEKAIAKAEPS